MDEINSDREPYILSIPLRQKVNRQWMTRDREEITIIPTASAYLVAHIAIDSHQGGWTLTHTPTMAWVATDLPTFEAAQLVAGAMCFLIDWSQPRRSAIVAQVMRLPPSLRHWLKSMSPNDWVLG